MVNKQALDKVIPYTDVFLYDIKGIDETTHIKNTGATNKTILENLLYLDKKGCKIEIRIPLVPNYNNKEIDKIATFIKPLKNVISVKVLAYHNLAKSKYTALDLVDTMPQKLPTAEEINLANKKLKRA